MSNNKPAGMMAITLRDLPSSLVLALIDKARQENTPLALFLKPFLEMAVNSKPVQYGEYTDPRTGKVYLDYGSYAIEKQKP